MFAGFVIYCVEADEKSCAAKEKKKKKKSSDAPVSQIPGSSGWLHA